MKTIYVLKEDTRQFSFMQPVKQEDYFTVLVPDSITPEELSKLYYEPTSKAWSKKEIINQ